RQLAEAQAAQGELAHVGARPAAQAASVAQPDLELRRLGFLRDLCGRGHFCPLSRRHALKGVPSTLQATVFGPSLQLALNGMPMNCRSLRASWSVFAVVTTDTFMPRALSTFM